MKIPTVHLNGDSKKTLLRVYCESMNAIQVAIEKTAETYPNGRNFYPQGSDAIGKAEIEHSIRMAKLRAVYAEIQEIMVAIYEGRTE